MLAHFDPDASAGDADLQWRAPILQADHPGRLGVRHPEAGIEMRNGSILVEDGTRITADLSDRRAADEICQRCLGGRLRGGRLAHASFFLGPRSFYEALRQMGLVDPQDGE